jgi:hypothetical protein
VLVLVLVLELELVLVLVLVLMLMLVRTGCSPPEGTGYCPRLAPLATGTAGIGAVAVLRLAVLSGKRLGLRLAEILVGCLPDKLRPRPSRSRSR